MTGDLQKLIDIVEAKVAGFNPARFHRSTSETAGQRIAEELVSEHGARVRRSPDYSISLGGVRSSCTSGWFGLFHNWQAAARRRLEQQEAR